MDMTKKILAITLIAAASSVAVYAYMQAKKKARRKDMPINFI